MSSRPAIPQGSPPTYAFVTRVYKRSLRPVVIVSASCSAIWTLLWGVANFRDIGRDKDDDLNGLVPFDIVLGALFSAAAAIEVFGIVAAVTQRIPLVRMYAFGTLAATALVFAAQIINIVIDFKYKANTDALVYVWHGYDVDGQFLTPEQANKRCKDLVNRQIVADFAWLIVTTILALLFASVVFSFYRQLLDPSMSRAPSDQFRMQTYNVYPAPAGPYGASGYAQSQNHVPPYDPAKLPEYDGSGRYTPEKELSYAPPAGPPPPQAGPNSTSYAPPTGPPPSHVAQNTFEPPAGPPPASNPFERRAEEP
ncbi:hypothetical protein BKA62DRAFT_685317 [Auriculariales sp. MPI-PUGE-AT-0066]|nr:hypothetical protein BKA62DRAFT_685317 [Auriculariales sp. MPI-PUGE-AT-0066]